MDKLDLNSDLGEWHPVSGKNHDIEIMPFLSSCNICCGFHSSSPELIMQTIRNSIRHDLSIGAHPSYNDREHFGRRHINTPWETLDAELRYQIGALKIMVETSGRKLTHIKAHGALYHDLHSDQELAELFIKLIKSIDPALKIMGMAGSQFGLLVESFDTEFIHEVFADRRYESESKLVSRNDPEAVITNDDMVIEQIGNILNGYVQRIDGSKILLKADSVCLHSDTLKATRKARLIHNYLQENNVRIHRI